MPFVYVCAQSTYATFCIDVNFGVENMCAQAHCA